MAASFKPNAKSYKANGAIKANSFVKLDTSSTNTKNPGIVAAGAGDAILGVSLNDSDAASGDEVEVGLPGGGARLKISGTVLLNQSIKATTNGYGIVTTTAGDKVGAMAIEGGLANDIIGVHVIRGEKYSSDAT